jgi:hypothetical protein
MGACGGTGDDSDRSPAAATTCDYSVKPPITEQADPGSALFACPTPATDPELAQQGFQYFEDVGANLQLTPIDDFETGAAEGTWYTQNETCWLCAKTAGLPLGTLVPNSYPMLPVLTPEACLCRCLQSQVPAHFDKPVPAERILVQGSPAGAEPVEGDRCGSLHAIRMRGGPFVDDGMKFARQMQASPVDAFALGYEGIAFWARVGGETDPSDGLQSSRNTLNLQVSDIFTDEKPSLIVESEGYVRTATWHGYAWAKVSGQGNTIAPTSLSGLAPRQPLCVSGTVARSIDPAAGPELGMTVNQAFGQSALETVVPTAEGLFFGFTGSVPSVNVLLPDGTVKRTPDGLPITTPLLRAQIYGPNGAADPNQRWCADLAEDGALLPWSSFNTRCWDNSGTNYAGQPLVSASVVIRPDPNAVAPIDYNFCLTSLSDGVAFCQANTPLNDTTQGCDKPNAFALLTTDWRFYALPFSEMRQAGWGKKQPYLDLTALMSVQFHFGAGQWDVWIDDVAFYRRKSQ